MVGRTVENAEYMFGEVATRVELADLESGMWVCITAGAVSLKTVKCPAYIGVEGGSNEGNLNSKALKLIVRYVCFLRFKYI